MGAKEDGLEIRSTLYGSFKNSIESVSLMTGLTGYGRSFCHNRRGYSGIFSGTSSRCVSGADRRTDGCR